MCYGDIPDKTCAYCWKRRALGGYQNEKAPIPFATCCFGVCANQRHGGLGRRFAGPRSIRHFTG